MRCVACEKVAHSTRLFRNKAFQKHKIVRYDSLTHQRLCPGNVPSNTRNNGEHQQSRHADYGNCTTLLMMIQLLGDATVHNQVAGQPGQTLEWECKSGSARDHWHAYMSAVVQHRTTPHGASPTITITPKTSAQGGGGGQDRFNSVSNRGILRQVGQVACTQHQRGWGPLVKKVEVMCRLGPPCTCDGDKRQQLDQGTDIHKGWRHPDVVSASQRAETKQVAWVKRTIVIIGR